MSTELPDFTTATATATAWMDALGGVVTQKQVMDYRGPLSDFSAGAPWTPLDTADAWVQRINRDKLAEVIDRALQEWHDGDLSGTDHDAVADAILAALPGLMGGGER